LTDQDLEKIGVASLGHGRKLLRAIAELNDADEPQLAAAAAPFMPAPIPTKAAVPPPITVAVDRSGLRLVHGRFRHARSEGG
jgi:hypothetical protein